MDERRRERAEKLFAGGRWRFVFLRGGVGWGLFVATGMAVWKALERSDYSLANIGWVSFLFDWLAGIPIYFLAGCLWGLLMWEFFVAMRMSREEENQK